MATGSLLTLCIPRFYLWPDQTGCSVRAMEAGLGIDREALLMIPKHPSNSGMFSFIQRIRSIVYAASATHVYRSTDDGETWTVLSGGLPSFDDPNDPNLSNRIRLSVTPASPSTLYVLYGSRFGFTNGLYRSDDRGNTFNKRSSTGPYVAGGLTPTDLTKPNILGYQDNDLRSQSHYTLAMSVSPTNADRVNVGGVDTWQSDDGGRSWKRTSNWRADGNPNFVHADIHILVYHDNSIYAASDGGVFRSSDGAQTWTVNTRMSTGVIITQVYNVCYSPKEPDLFYYGAQDNGTWRLHEDGDVERVLGGDGMKCQVDPSNPKAVYASLPYGQILRSDDGAQTFAADITPTQGLQNTPVSGAWVTPYILAPDDPTMIYGCYEDLWRSTDQGFTWNDLTGGKLGASSECRQVAISPAAPATIYVAKDSQFADALFFARRGGGGDSRPAFLGGGGLFRSTDGGVTWKDLSRTLPLEKAQISDVAVSPINAQYVWVTFLGTNAETKVYGSTDGGKIGPISPTACLILLSRLSQLRRTRRMEFMLASTMESIIAMTTWENGYRFGMDCLK